ncbi:MAG TPA: hypothetical protein VF834_25190 [Streptosporangiaceae bacterium]
MDQPQSGARPYAGTAPLTPVPVFTDPSGQRRRLMRLIGAGASVFLVGVLILVGIGLFGGPSSRLSVFGPQPQQPPGPHSTHAGKRHHGTRDHSTPAPDRSTSRSPSPAPSSSRPASPSPSGSPSPSPSHGHAKSPHPHPSPSSTHGK